MRGRELIVFSLRVKLMKALMMNRIISHSIAQNLLYNKLIKNLKCDTLKKLKIETSIYER